MNVFRCVPFIIFMIASCTAHKIGMTFQCPQLFHNGNNIIICKINKTAIEEANCKLKYDDVTFEWIDSAGESVGCQAVYNTTEKCTSGDKHLPGSCWCAESSGEIFTYKYSFLANSSRDKGRQLTCSLCGMPQNYLNISISDGCKNMTFDDHEDSETDNKSKPANSDVGLILGVLGGLVMLVLTMITVICVKKRLSFLYFCKTKKRTSAVEDRPEQKELMSSTSKEGKQCGKREQKDHLSVHMPNGKGLLKTLCCSGSCSSK